MAPERIEKLAIWRRRLVRWLGQASGKLDVVLSRILANCTRDTPCLSAACEPPRVRRRPFGLSYAAMAGWSSMA